MTGIQIDHGDAVKRQNNLRMESPLAEARDIDTSRGRIEYAKAKSLGEDAMADPTKVSRLFDFIRTSTSGSLAMIEDYNMARIEDEAGVSAAQVAVQHNVVIAMTALENAKPRDRSVTGSIDHFEAKRVLAIPTPEGLTIRESAIGALKDYVAWLDNPDTYATRLRTAVE